MSRNLTLVRSRSPPFIQHHPHAPRDQSRCCGAGGRSRRRHVQLDDIAQPGAWVLHPDLDLRRERLPGRVPALPRSVRSPGTWTFVQRP
jgi:hypothetical protein